MTIEMSENFGELFREIAESGRMSQEKAYNQLNKHRAL